MDESFTFLQLIFFLIIQKKKIVFFYILNVNAQKQNF